MGKGIGEEESEICVLFYLVCLYLKPLLLPILKICFLLSLTLLVLPIKFYRYLKTREPFLYFM